MGIIQCCELSGNKGEEAVRSIMHATGISKINQLSFVNNLKVKSKDNHINLNDFFDCMDKYWDENEESKLIQKHIFSKYLTTLVSDSSEINIYEICLICLPLMNMSVEEKRIDFKILLKYINNETKNISYKKIKRQILNYYNFHTNFLSKAMYYEFKELNKQKECHDLRVLILNVYNDENINKEVNSTLIEYEKDITNNVYLSDDELERIIKKLYLNFDDIRDLFISKYAEV